MSPTSCRCSTPRRSAQARVGGLGVRAAASPPTRLPAQYFPALAPGTTRFGMGRGGIGAALGHAHTQPPNPQENPKLWLQAPCAMPAPGLPPDCVRSALDHEHGFAPVGCPPSTCRLVTGWSARGLPSLRSQKAHLGAGFPLRCCQRLSLPNVATQRCRLPDNWHTSGSSSPVLSY